MRVMVIGSGGREHAIGWKLAQSPRHPQLFFAPGNGGTAQLGLNLPVPAENLAGIVQVGCEQQVDLVIVGSEVPLALGVTDALAAAGLRVFGPSKTAAQLEASKAFAKAFMQAHAIPTARAEVFSDFAAAASFLTQVDYPIVLKASGLAAGKGVILPESPAQAEQALRGMLLEGEFGAAGHTVVVEERLAGEEVSVLAFTDGVTVRPMPPAQDHKRLLDGDHGPNTGGMGAYAPASICPPERVAEIVRTILQPAVDGMRLAGTPFVGVLYAGLMLTDRGPQVLEFNCRFGDPETQAILPLLDTDLLEIVEACLAGSLAELEIRWREGSAACVVLASQGYPGKSTLGRPISGLDVQRSDGMIFQAGTRLEGEQVLTSGGRVLGVTGWGPDLKCALGNAYEIVQGVSFDGCQYRKDIGWRSNSLSLPASGREGRGGLGSPSH